ncbi:MAG: fibronectin type III domain-containing protein, partial [Bacteroidota bacterium]
MKKIISLSFIILFVINKSNAQNIRFTEMVGKPTNSSATIQMFFSDSAEMQVQYGTTSGTYPNQTQWSSFSANLPAEITLTGLQPDTKYYYRVRHRVPGTNTPTSRAEYFFHTQRNPGSSFSFVVEADPHSDEQSDSTLYAKCLQNQLSDNPDFMIDLGDFLMTDKLKNRTTNLIPRDTITYRCNVFRNFYQISSHSVPLFIALGNHEGEAGWNRVGARIDSTNNIAIWDALDRKKYFMNPA